MSPESDSRARLHAVEASGGEESAVEGPLHGYHHETYVFPLPGDPLGESPDETDLRAQWTELHDALTLFQRSRTQQRLAELHARRETERARRGLPPTGEVGSPRASAVTRQARRATEDEQQRQQRPGPGLGPHRGPRS